MALLQKQNKIAVRILFPVVRYFNMCKFLDGHERSIPYIWLDNYWFYL